MFEKNANFCSVFCEKELTNICSVLYNTIRNEQNECSEGLQKRIDCQGGQADEESVILIYSFINYGSIRIFWPQPDAGDGRRRGEYLL